MPDLGGILGAAGEVFKRVVQKPPPRKAPPKPAAPQSDYTKDVIARGSQAVKDRAAGAVLDRAQGKQQLDWAAQTGLPTGDPTDQYVQWYASKGFQPQYTPTFGRTPKGKYSGYATEGELKAATLGTAEQYRAQDRQSAAQQAHDAQAALDALLGRYDTQHGQATSEMDELNRAIEQAQHPKQGVGSFFGDLADAGRKFVGLPVSEHAPVDVSDKQSRLKDLTTYDQQLNEWLAQVSKPKLDEMQTAQQISQTPLRAYTTLAGRDYGIDPALIGGWYPESSELTDYTNQRNLQSIDDYGMPYNDVQSWFAEQQRAADAADRQATTDATAADKQAATDEEQQITAIVGDATGMDAKQLAQATNMTPMQVAQVVSDPGYQQAAADLGGILTDPEFDPERDSDALNTVLDQIRTNPQMYAILTRQFSDYLS